nr:PREDICTED: phenoloxidase 2-like isoform X1 [Bemisia tabaci]XP_018902182.1 PREDICTED: phenoloxidase 2-like isoform X1 [Bemisia tabaci]
MNIINKLSLLTTMFRMLGVGRLSNVADNGDLASHVGEYEENHHDKSITYRSDRQDDSELILKLFNNPYNKLSREDFDFATADSHRPFEMPDFELSEIQTLDRRTHFSAFDPLHRELAAKLIKIFMRQRDLKELVSMSGYLRDEVHPDLFNYALSITLMHRKDTSNLQVPLLATVMPHKFIDAKILRKVKEAIKNGTYDSNNPIFMTPQQTTSKDENLLHYFREDIGVSTHHWQWHLLHPYRLQVHNFGEIIPPKNRRGELFYFMHQQVLARYHFERYSNGLKRTADLRFEEHKPIPEPYYAKIERLPSIPYASREKNTILRTFKYPPNETVTVKDIQLWGQRILDSIRQGTVLYENGTIITPKNEEYIDILGNMVEACTASPNLGYYGSLHNKGHAGIGQCHGPKGVGVMYENSCSMRDPVFYRWHGFVNWIFNRHKERLPPYTVEQLGFDGVKIESVTVHTQDESVEENEFLTHWEQSFIDVSNGLNIPLSNGTEKYSRSSPVLISYRHMQHRPFTYTIIVNSDREVTGTVRIFLAPAYDPDLGENFHFYNQRNVFVELDKFVVQLKASTNDILRHSAESTLTVTTDFRQPLGKTLNAPKFNKLRGCGWPEYLLIPKGTPEGLASKLFVMISDWENGDKVSGSVPTAELQAENPLCGVTEGLYPYKRPMGFPFDRRARDDVETLDDFIHRGTGKRRERFSNMYVVDTKIRFDGSR